MGENEVAYHFADQLVKANSDVLSRIDGDPKMQEQMEQDMAKMGQVKFDVDAVLATLFDNQPWGTREDADYRRVDRALGKSMLLRRAGQTEAPRMIKNLRRLQITDFAELASSRKYGKEIGFTLAWKQPERKTSEKEERQRKYWEQKIQAHFFFPAGEATPSLSKFLSGMYEDWFDLDDITIAVHRDKLFEPIGLHIEDPSLWFHTLPRLAQYTRFDQDMLQDLSSTADADVIEMPDADYVMMKDDVRLRAATRDQVFKSHFFAMSDYRLWLRGYSIMEQAANVVAIIMNALTYNASNFTNNRLPAGMLALSGGMTNTLVIEKVKKLLWASMTGSQNARRMPVIGLPENAEAKWVGIHGTAKEMEFYTGMTLFVSVVCALSGTDPNELGLASFHDAIKSAGLSDTNQDGIWKRSRDNGLKTFLNYAENILNTGMSDGRNVFEQATGLPVVAQFRGLAEEDVKAKTEVNKLRADLDTSINDIRAENGDEPVEYKVGDVNIYDMPGITNASIGGFIRMDAQMKQQEKMQQQQADAQQQAAAGQQQGGEQAPEMTDADQQLIDKYGAPEDGEQAGQGAPGQPGE